MKTLNTTMILVLGCGLVLATNAAILGMAAWNRQGEVLSVLSLTERELAMPEYRQEENSGFMLSLRLTHEITDAMWRTAQLRDEKSSAVEYSWFNRGKLAELGFAVEIDPADPSASERYKSTMGRTAFVVIEFDGDGWREWLTGREEQVRTMRDKAGSGEETDRPTAIAEQLLEWDRTTRSRLFPVDAGTDIEQLRSRYPDRQRYAIIKVVVGLRLSRPKGGAPYLKGIIRDKMVSGIHVPMKHRDFLQAFLPDETRRESAERLRKEAEDGWPAPMPPRYRAELTFGSRNDPWLSGVEPAGEPAGTSPPQS